MDSALERRFIGPVAGCAHLVWLGEGPALCGVEPPEWYGTGSQDEYEAAEWLPLCPRCAAAAGVD